MERIVKLGLVLLIICGLNMPASADTVQTPSTVPQSVNLSQCVKTFNIGFEKLFLLTQIAISTNNYTIDEIQSEGGYIVFSVNRYKFLATVFTFGDKSILKITPCNGNYTFPAIIIKNVFKYVEQNQSKKY